MMRRMQEDLDRLFGQFVGGAGTEGGLGMAPGTTGLPQVGIDMPTQWLPNVDLSETNRELLIEVDLPGAVPENVEVEIRDSQLVLRGEVLPPEEAEISEEGQRRYFRRERRYGYFEQVLSLPENVRQDEITAEVRNGVLRIHLPKTEEARQGRKINVTEASAQPQRGQRQQAGQGQAGAGAPGRETAGTSGGQQQTSGGGGGQRP
jgi:HSP20 family molecular chaperone IbpA